MNGWQAQLKKSITRPEALAARFGVDQGQIEGVAAVYPMRISPYYLGLIRQAGDPIWRQAVPDQMEILDEVCLEDPLGEEDLSPVSNLIHKYPDRVLFLVSSQCAVYCRFCTRKRKVGTSRMAITDGTISAGLEYIRKHPMVRDVLLSGGDPLLLPDGRLASILGALREIPTVEIIRIGSRVPCTFPMRVTNRLAAMLKRFHPLYINTHFNHPAEITPESATACAMLVNAGIPLGCQTVLLKGVNDDVMTMKTLMHRLLSIRVKPYYLFQADMTRGTNHFRTTVEKGLEIMDSLIGHTSGMAVPTYAVDAPGGRGKIPLLPGYDVIHQAGGLTFKNYLGQPCSYHY